MQLKFSGKWYSVKPNFFRTNSNTGDTVVTFNDRLSNEDFGCNWGSSHSLIQSVTTDSKYFLSVH